MFGAQSVLQRCQPSGRGRCGSVLERRRAHPSLERSATGKQEASRLMAMRRAAPASGRIDRIRHFHIRVSALQRHGDVAPYSETSHKKRAPDAEGGRMSLHTNSRPRLLAHRSATPRRGVGRYRRRCREGLGPHSGRSASRSSVDSVFSGKLGARLVRSKKGCGHVFPRERHPTTMRTARPKSHGLSRVDPSGG